MSQAGILKWGFHTKEKCEMRVFSLRNFLIFFKNYFKHPHVLLYESHVCVVSLMTDNSTGDNQWQKIVYFFKKWSLFGQKKLILHFSWINSRPLINRLPQIIAYLLGIPIVLKKMEDWFSKTDQWWFKLWRRGHWQWKLIKEPNLKHFKCYLCSVYLTWFFFI